MYEPCACCGGIPLRDGEAGQGGFSAEAIDNLWSEIERIAGDAYNSGSAPTHDPKLLAGVAAQLVDRLTQGYGKQMDEVRYGQPDWQMLRNLTENVYEFSAAKNWHELKDITLALTDGDRLRTESEFIDAVKQLNDKYNDVWLRTERDTAIAGGQMAGRWVDFEKNADILPMLKYVTAGDGNVRPAHVLLDGVTKPVGAPFWDEYYPPNGWRCRCDVVQLPDRYAAPTPDKQIHAPYVQPLFKTNLAKTGLIFPKEHPYYSGIPRHELIKAIAYLPPGNSYTATKTTTGKAIDVHLLHGKNEMSGNMNVAEAVILQGYNDVKMLPVFNEDEAHLRQKFLPEGYRQKDVKKNPDFRAEAPDEKQIVGDLKLLTGKGSFQHRIGEAAAQADHAFIKLDFDMPASEVKGRVGQAVGRHENLKTVAVFNKDNELIYKYEKK